VPSRGVNETVRPRKLRETRATTSVLAILGDDQDITNGETTHYQRLPAGRLVSEAPPAAPIYHFHDLHGDVACLTNSSGAKVDTYANDPYGNLTSPNVRRTRGQPPGATTPPTRTPPPGCTTSAPATTTSGSDASPSPTPADRRPTPSSAPGADPVDRSDLSGLSFLGSLASGVAG